MFFRCRTWHVSGVIFVKCFFFFPLLPYSISCVFNVLLPYTSGIFLFMCDYWSCVIGWVCLTMAGVLCSPSDLYMPVHPMCNNHCIAFDVSPPVWLSLRLAFRHPWPFCKTTSCDNFENKLSYFIMSKKLGKTIFGIKTKLFRNSLQTFGKTWPWASSSWCSWSPSLLRFMEMH